MSESVQVYKLKVTLEHSRPPIWRRIQVKSDITLPELHRILQTVMGWRDAHLHRFLIWGEYYGLPDEHEVNLSRAIDETKYSLCDLVLGVDSRFQYDYDFGDGWQHSVHVEQILPPQEGVHYPLCLEGARACPPEDVGGMPGYRDFLVAICDPRHPQHKECLEWIGGDFDPEKFDVDEVNRALRGIR